MNEVLLEEKGATFQQLARSSIYMMQVAASQSPKGMAWREWGYWIGRGKVHG
jgi:hypothetical protein